MEINRVWAMPNKNTFSIKPIANLLERWVISQGGVIVDPFANGSKIATITNDLNPEFDTTYHMDALDFLKLLETSSCDCVLYDPPYSLRQVSESYKGFGIEVTQETTQASWLSLIHISEPTRP